MAYQIIVKKRFTSKIIKLLNYLESEWSKDVADEFIKKLDKRIDTISKQPFTGIQIKIHPEVRSILVTKHNRLYYRIRETTIEILNLYDTRTNPNKNPYQRK